MSRVIVSIVEGHGEVKAVPNLLRRLRDKAEAYELEIDNKGFRQPRSKLVKPDGLENAIQTALRKKPGCVAIVVLLDADDDCPAELGPSLLQRIEGETTVPSLVVLAMREFETWFMGSIESLQGTCEIDRSAQPPSDPETIRDAKGWIKRQMPKTRKYVPPRDQPTLTAKFDLDLAAKRCPSFARLCRCFSDLAEQLRSQMPKQAENGTS